MLSIAPDIEDSRNRQKSSDVTVQTCRLFWSKILSYFEKEKIGGNMNLTFLLRFFELNNI